MFHGMGTIITGGLTKNYHTMSHREKIFVLPSGVFKQQPGQKQNGGRKRWLNIFLSWAELYKYNDTD